MTYKYSTPSRPPQDCPSKCKRSRPRACRTSSISSAKRRRSQRARTGFVRFAATKLVVKDHWAIIAEGLQRFEIVTSCARPASSVKRGIPSPIRHFVPDPVAIFKFNEVSTIHRRHSRRPVFDIPVVGHRGVTRKCGCSGTLGDQHNTPNSSTANQTSDFIVT